MKYTMYMIINWYKKAQSYEEVRENRQTHYDDPEDLSEQIAEEYFSIGQSENENGKRPSFCWIWDGGSLFAKRGPGSHQVFFRHLFHDVFAMWRGWYDPNQQLISIVYPERKSSNIFDKYTDKDVPLDLKSALRKKFGTKARMIVF